MPGPYECQNPYCRFESEYVPDACPKCGQSGVIVRSSSQMGPGVEGTAVGSAVHASHARMTPGVEFSVLAILDQLIADEITPEQGATLVRVLSEPGVQDIDVLKLVLKELISPTFGWLAEAFGTIPTPERLTAIQYVVLAMPVILGAEYEPAATLAVFALENAKKRFRG
jgi:hypothetical protein